MASDGETEGGRLVLLVGPSGAGKDSLLEAVRPLLQAQGVEIAQRVITRSAEAVGEQALAVTEQQFDDMSRDEAFALQWRANGLQYGITRQLDAWLEQGRSVLVNGSRGHLAQARARYPQALVICLEVSMPVLRQRLQARGRETPDVIEQRLARSGMWRAENLPDVRRLDNSGELNQAVQDLLALLRDEGIIAPRD
ncbi:ribose-phosphate pyrophosphokinase [Pseudomonas cremoricolorata]|uniref:Ribose 1,5-bisphosphate phosphokinase PhnN n=1 Tax=Pseudomonas cremoricolorata TaxID=157783 RepID=A0A089YE48_9PSED|nr:ribose-phosphate pyrophosphokinase [Pseudomonas cremoricolorata]